MEKKNLAIIILAVVLAASGVGNVILAMMTVVVPPVPGEVLKVARTANPVTMDPLDAWDSVSNDMLDQVVEPLVATDLTDPTFPLVGRLAETWDFNIGEHGKYNNLTFYLRENVFFHDGELFTGEDVIHTFERINFFGNWTGTLDPALYVQAFPHSLYKFGDGTPIFNDTLSRAWWDAHKAADPYTVMLIMNGAFAPAEGLLAYTASSIVSHVSAPADAMLDLGTDLVIGTGPFKLVRYVPNSEIRFARWERYWRTGAYWDQIVYVYYRDGVTANNAMLALDIDFLGQGIASLKPDFEADPDITVTGDGTAEFINGSIYWYIAFNAPYINQTWRKALSYAFNYTYLIQEIDEDTTVRANSLVPPGFPAHNYSTTAANYDIPVARGFMQKMGYGAGWEVGSQVGDVFTGGADEALWEGATFYPATGNFTGGNWNFRHRQGSHFMELLIQRFTEDMNKIGVNIVPQVLTWDEFIRLGQLHPDRLHVYFVGWGPDYFETFNMIDPLVNPASSSNFARINDAHLNDLLATTAAETDTATRYQYYKQLQGYIHDVRFFHMPLTYDKLYHVHAETLKGFPYNSMRNLYWYPTYREV
ncbi:MAG: ABC transporter substrate-binding protein [Candidatus Thorarchaeota archaeon]